MNINSMKPFESSVTFSVSHGLILLISNAVTYWGNQKYEKISIVAGLLFCMIGAA
jgi:hypothetical protein